MDKDRHRGNDESPDVDNAAPDPLACWRKFGAESFDERRIAEVEDFVARISSTIPEWRKTIEGDAAAAANEAAARAAAAIGARRTERSR
ncbi:MULTISPECIES: hypothetical protein [unclassified Bradyrhizobium]|uniref:hypothetical protein n=1 Tax=unclassified Bradyrhizobium TaxID=2631580 RepID=UPI002FEFD83F